VQLYYYLDYTKAIQLRPNDPDAYNNRGFDYTKEGNSDQALADLNKAIELDPNLWKNLQ
jgi:Flp pilus assembly protein TadD